MTRRSIVSRLLVVLAVAGLGFAVPAVTQAGGGSSTPPAPGTTDIGGTVYSISRAGGYVMVETQKGCFQPVYPVGSTIVTKNGAPASASGIAVGQRIRSSNSIATGKALTIDLR